MAFEHIRIAQFRNIEEAELELGTGNIFLLGENGQGKTNFLEALYCLSYGNSFRTHQDRDLIMHERSDFLLRAEWSEPGYIVRDQISLRYLPEGRKEILLNQKRLLDRKELVAHNPSVVFCHEDLAFASGAPEERRFFFDQCAGMLWLEYIDLLRSYRRLLKHRNIALKTDTFGLLDTLDEQLARYGSELMFYRKKLSRLFEDRFPERYEQVSQLGTEVSIQYRPNWPEEASISEIVETLAHRRQKDIEAGTTLSGPHRDRWVFTMEGRDFSAFASTGQLRLASLILRVVQVYLFSELSQGGKPRFPVLLVDDVLLELDVAKRRRFFSLLPEKEIGAQSVFTFLPEEPWREYANWTTIVYKVSHGRFSREESI
ncbi:MAG TPA: DNA replication and repair protein RecF [Rectinema sp.]|nr:DNA replication and repair protein RecF [Rectinema sp.]HPY04930.1 DNA replication and repair protein RecF [Rectinema sp.]HQC16739.1 DNA replication and repair protein RecF [Rectinema sp.]